MSNSIQYTASYDNLANLSSMEKTGIDDTRELGLDRNKLIATSREKPTGIFSSVKMFFRAFFRSDQEAQQNNDVYTRVKQDIKNIYGKEAAEKFESHMAFKIQRGAPLTKGALIKFMKSEELSLDKSDIMANLLAQEIHSIDNDGKRQMPQSKQAGFNQMKASLKSNVLFSSLTKEQQQKFNKLSSDGLFGKNMSISQIASTIKSKLA